MTATEIPLRLTPQQALAEVEKEFPEERGKFRRIHDVAEGAAFRVNFHDEDTNQVVKSFFVRVNGSKLVY